MLTVMIETRQDGHLQSKVPVQFTVEIMQIKKSDCDYKRYRPMHEMCPCFTVQKGKEYTASIEMEAVRGESIIEVQSIMPTGMKVIENTPQSWGVGYDVIAFYWPAKYVMPGTYPVCFLYTRTYGFMSRQMCIEIDVYSGDLTNVNMAIAPPTKENNFTMMINCNFEVKVPSKEGAFMLLIAKTVNNLVRALIMTMKDENYKELNNTKFKVYDLAKQTIPVSVNADDKNSFILDLHSVLGYEVISERTRFISWLYIREYNLWYLIKYPPCSRHYKHIADMHMYYSEFDGKAALFN